MFAARRIATAAVTVSALAAFPSLAQQPLAYVPVNSGDGVKVSGALEVTNGRASVGTNGTITAGDSTATIALARGGQLRLCSSTTLHLTADRSANQLAQAIAAASPTTPPAPSPAALLIALDRGAFETNYVTGRYSDVVMTPDFRILVSGPGTADLKIRVNSKGDTCIDNHGGGAPYITVSSQFDPGVYRVQPNQRVLFEHGSLHDVVDDEKESCGCPPPPQMLTAQVALPPKPAAANAPAGFATPTPDSFAIPTQPAATPTTAATASTSTNAAVPNATNKPANTGTEFPLAVSEGLAPPPPAQPAQPITAGEVHVQVTVPLAYNGVAGTTATAASGSANVPAAPAPPPPAQTPASSTPAVVYAPAPPAVPIPKPDPASNTGFFHRIGRFFSKLFGGG
jgi:hypothetical protein